MFAGIFRFELRYQLRNPVFWVAAAIFFLLTFGLVTVQQISVGLGASVHKNAPGALAQYVQVFSLFYMFVSTAFVANVIVRDDDTGFGPIVRATRITRVAYLLGRYAGAFTAAAIGFLAIPLGAWVGSHMPWVDPEQLGPNRLAYYLQPYLLLGLPNLFLTSALFFALATATRSMMATYVGVVAFLILWTIATVVLDRNPAYELWGAYGEPLGFGALGLVTKYWTAADRNSLLLPVEGVLLWNRIAALVIGAIALGAALATFRFTVRPTRKARRAARAEARVVAEPAPVTAGPLPAPRHDRAAAWAQLRARTALEMGQVFKSPAYLVLLVLGLFQAMAALIDLSQLFGTPVVPVTRIVIQLLEGSFGLIPIIIAIYYAGELVWRERDRKIHEIVDASAIPDWAYVVPKVLAVMLVLFSTLLVSVAGGILMQLYHGYSHVEPGKYLLWYVLPTTVSFTLLAVLAVFIQALSPHKFVGWGLMLLWIVSRATFGNLGWADPLYSYGQSIVVPRSDMNGLGQYWIGAWWFRLYWSAFAVILLVLCHALWRRGTETRLRPRLRRLPSRLRGQAGLVGGAALTVFAATGAWLYINTHVWNEYRDPVSAERFQADYEKALLRYETVPQPSIAAVRVAVDLRPRQPGLSARGVLTLVNRTGRPLSFVHVQLGVRDTRLTALSIPGTTLVRDYPRFQYRIYRFTRPLAPGATTTLAFRSERAQHGFRAGGNDVRVVGNGTFISNLEFVPVLGMSRGALLQDRVRRRKYGLPSELRPARLGDLGPDRHHRLHRRGPDAGRAGRQGGGHPRRRPPHRPLRHHRADPELFLGPVGALPGKACPSPRRRPGGLLRAEPRPQRRPHARRLRQRAGLLPAGVRALPVPLCPHRRVPGLRPICAGVRRDDAPRRGSPSSP